MAICVYYSTPNTMADNNTALMSIDAQQRVMRMATEAPEDIYAVIKAAEDWVDELKEIARENLNKKFPKEETSHDFDTPLNIINVTRNRGNFKPEMVHEILTKLKIPTENVTYVKPVQYGCKPEAFDILSAYLKQNILTQAQFDSMFEKGKFVVKVKPKSNMAIALNRMDSGE